MELIEHERQSLEPSRMVGTLVSPRPFDLPRLPPWAAPNGWDYWGRPWVYLDAPSTLTPPSTSVTVAVLVDCLHELQFLPDMTIAQSSSVAAGSATHQAWPFTQKGDIQDNLKLEVAAKRLWCRGYGDGYSTAVLDQLKAWETFRSLDMGWRENSPMPTADVTPPECPRARCHGQAPDALSGCPVVPARAAETACWSQTTSSKTVTADRKL